MLPGPVGDRILDGEAIRAWKDALVSLGEAVSSIGDAIGAAAPAITIGAYIVILGVAALFTAEVAKRIIRR